MERKLGGLTGKMMTSRGDICVLLPPSFASAEMASRAIEDAVSNPMYEGIQDSTSTRNNKIHQGQIGHPQGTSTDKPVKQVSYECQLLHWRTFHGRFTKLTKGPSSRIISMFWFGASSGSVSPCSEPRLHLACPLDDKRANQRNDHGVDIPDDVDTGFCRG